MPITLSDIQHLSDEVSALVDAGLPLEQNLADAGRGHGRRLRRLTEDLSQRLNSGESLDDIVSRQPSGASRVLAAAVSAGIRSGDLGTAIELAGDLAGDLLDLRQRVARAVAYPLSVALLAMSLFLFFIRMFLGQVYDILNDIGLRAPALAVWIHQADQVFPYWPWAFPLVVLLLFAVWWVATQSHSVVFEGPLRWLMWLPGVRALVRDMQFYSTTRMIHLLIERKLPLTDALILAGSCSGSFGLDRACRQEAERLRKQQPATISKSVWKRGRLPPLLEVCLSQQGDERLLSDRLNGLAGHYQRRVELGLAWMQHVMPGALLLIVGGGAVLAYSLSLIWPVKELYESLGKY